MKYKTLLTLLLFCSCSAPEPPTTLGKLVKPDAEKAITELSDGITTSSLFFAGAVSTNYVGAVGSIKFEDTKADDFYPFLTFRYVTNVANEGEILFVHSNGTIKPILETSITTEIGYFKDLNPTNFIAVMRGPKL